MRKTLTLFAVLSLTLCACAPTVVAIPPASCATLIPDGWKEPVAGVPIPATPTPTADTLEARLEAALEAARLWAAAFVGESLQREKANGRAADTIAIITECEAKVNAAR